ncbi:MutT/NUDIX family protein [Nostocoides japonicum T1-X7]|uniref:MutT/NUDIX family protein n=2 Tax=Nostocoides japonicum TaxID=99481 RepID=A0A077LW83_9MICO|nr:MutT/NUDIX family protein [Tetrasphaera japonica T1-X7]
MPDSNRDDQGIPKIRLGAAPTIRVAAKALIIRDAHILMTVNSEEIKRYYLCPGGGQEHGEDVRTALRRECHEELDCDVTVGEFAFMRDYIGADHEFPAHSWAHALETYFFCELAPGAEPRLVGEGDPWQTGVAWLSLATLANEPLYPKALVHWLAAPEGSRPGYLGNVN